MSHDAAMQAPRVPQPSIAEHGAWRLRFWSIWIGQASSLIGSSLTQFVLLWWITDTTGSVQALATAGMMGLVPQVLLGPLGGTLADRFSRRMIIIVADTISALCVVVLIALFATNSVQLWHIYMLMFVRSSMGAFQQPAVAASAAMLVPPSMLPRVAGYGQTVQGIITIAAAPLGALALTFLPLQGALAIDVVTATLGLVPLFVFVIPQPVRADGPQPSIWQAFGSGVRFVLGNRGLAMLYGVLVLVVMTITPTLMLTPLLVREHFGGSVQQVALMEGLSGAGIIVGGIVMGVLPLVRRPIIMVLVSFAVSCGAVALTALTPAHLFWLATVWWVVSGITYATGNAPLVALIQTLVPNELQGRVLALLNTAVGLTGLLGLIVSGALGSIVGVRGVFVIGGLLAAAVALLGFASPSLRNIEDRLRRDAGTSIRPSTAPQDRAA